MRRKYTINRTLRESLSERDRIILEWEPKLQQEWEDLKKDIQKSYKYYKRPLSHELKWNYKQQWELLIRQAEIIGFDEIEAIRDDFDTFMDENDYNRNWCVILVGSRKKVNYNAKLHFIERKGWPTDFDRECQVIDDYLTEEQANGKAAELNKTLGKSRILFRMKYLPIKMNQVVKYDLEVKENKIMKRNNKALYEKIMRNVSKEVKKALNEMERTMDRSY